VPFSCAFPDLFSENPIHLSLEPPPLLRMGEKQEKEKNREGRREREREIRAWMSFAVVFVLRPNPVGHHLLFLFSPQFHASSHGS